MTPRISTHRFISIQTQMYRFICYQSEKQTICQVGAVTEKHDYYFIVCWSFDSPPPRSSIDNSLYGQAPFYIFCKTPTFENIYLDILPK